MSLVAQSWCRFLDKTCWASVAEAQSVSELWAQKPPVTRARSAIVAALLGGGFTLYCAPNRERLLLAAASGSWEYDSTCLTGRCTQNCRAELSKCCCEDQLWSEVGDGSARGYPQPEGYEYASLTPTPSTKPPLPIPQQAHCCDKTL